MKINRSIIKASLCILFMGSIAACTTNFEDINRDPYGVGDDEMGRDGYNISSALIGMQSWVVSTTVLTYQFTDSELGDTWGGYLAPCNSTFNEGRFATYCAPDNWTKVMFTDIIPKLYSSRRLLLNVTTDPVSLAVAEVIKVAAMHRITDCYGPIPYSQIGLNGQLKAPYDSQEQVYNNMFNDLNAAIVVLTEHQVERLNADADKVFAGNIVKWIKFANSIKLRLAMRLVYVANDKAKQMAEEAVNHSIGTMVDNTDNATLASYGKDGYPLYKIMYDWNSGDSRISADIMSYMNGYSDPRREKFFMKSKFTASDGVTNDYIGLRSGIDIADNLTAQKYSNANISPNSAMQWMNAAEVAFLKAEAALYGWNVGGTAESFYRKGVELSFTQYGVSGASTYLTNASSTAKQHVDPKQPGFSYSGVMSTITIKWDNAAAQEKNLERIITQKWIANFTLGHESWAEYRRTGYPKLMPALVNKSAGGIVNSNQGARRLQYPLDEYTANAENVQFAVTTQLGGPDNMATKVWWDCKK